MIYQTDSQALVNIKNKNFKIMRGWPGYRNRTGRSGLDYIDTTAEAGHVAGTLFRQLLTGEWLYSNSGIHPLSFLFVATVIVVGYLGPLFCPAFLIGILMAVLKSQKVQIGETLPFSEDEQPEQDENR